MTEKEKIVGLHGSYFTRNFGDTLILWIVKNWIEDVDPGLKIGLPFVSSEEEAYEILDSENVYTDVREYDALIFGPGGYFGERPNDLARRLKWSLRNYKRHLKWNKILYKDKIPYAIIGVGVGPLTYRFIRRKVTRLFKNAALISVRDKYSKEYLVKWGLKPERIHVVNDVALTLKNKEEKHQENQVKKKFGIHLSGINSFSVDKQKAILDFIEDIAVDYELYFIEDAKDQINLNNEGNVGYLLKRRGIEPTILNYESPSKLVRALSKFDYLITSKLHVGIVGYTLGIPVLSVPLHSKTIRFYEQIKREKYCLYEVDYDKDKLYNIFEDLKGDKIKKNILYTAAIRNKELIKEFLKKIDYERV